MAAEIIKVYKQDVPILRFIGKKYGDNDRINGTFHKKWNEWAENKWFEIIFKQTDKDITTLHEDGGAYIGLMRGKNGEPFEYWIGTFMPAETTVPDGFEYHDFPQTAWGVCWVSGNNNEIFMHERKCRQKLEAEGYEIIKDSEEVLWFFERYARQRFTTPNENGKVILDICWYVK